TLHRIRAETAAPADEPNLDESGDRCYGDGVISSGNVATFMSKPEGAKIKLSFWETIRQSWGPYRRLYSYAGPYKARFALGLGFGVAYSLVTSLLPVAVYRVSSFVFPGGAPNPRTAILHREAFNVGPKIDSILWICLAIPLIMTVRSLCSYGGAYYM